jgi:hypothetical protein
MCMCCLFSYGKYKIKILTRDELTNSSFEGL